MGRHSGNKHGIFGGGGPGGSRRPIRRRVPRSIASGAELSGVGASRAALSGDKITDPGSRRRGPLESAPERLRAERDRRRKRGKRIALMAAGSVVGLVMVSAVGLYAYAKHLQSTMQKTVYQQEKLVVQLEKTEPQKPFNVLLLGFDKRAKDTIYRSDTLILARVDPKTKQVWMLSIPRDTKVQIPGYGTRKVNEAFALGQEQLAIKTVEKFAGVPVHHFVGINFKGFHRAVDAMGGVWVDVAVEIDDPAADSSPGNRSSHIDPGYQLLDGEHALTYVRTRHTFADQDFGRMRNQQTFFLALADQIALRTSVAKLPRIVAAIAPYISTDMSLIEMMRTAQALQGAGSKRVYTETIAGEWVSPYVVTDEEKMAVLMQKFASGLPFKDPEPSTEPSSAVSAGSQDAAAEVVVPADTSVTVRNGSGIAGCAKQVSSILKARAFQVGDVGNAGQFVYEKTLVVYKSNKAAAELVASALPPGTRVVQSRGMYAFDSDVLVVVGKDWDVAKVPLGATTER